MIGSARNNNAINTAVKNTVNTTAKQAHTLSLALLLSLGISPLTLAANNTTSSVYYILDQTRSIILIQVSRAGFLKALGHDHLVTTTTLKGELFYSSPPAVGASFYVSFPVDTLVVDDPVRREQAGERFSSPISDAAREGTRSNMLSDAILDAARHPEIVIEGRWIEGSLPQGTVDSTITMRGMKRHYAFPVDVDIQPESVKATGTLQLAQTDFGIIPLSILGGSIKVADRIDLQYSLVFIPSP